MNDLILNIECQHNTEQIHSLIIDIPVLVWSVLNYELIIILIINNSIYILHGPGGPRHKPVGVSRGSLGLQFYDFVYYYAVIIIMYQ